MANVASSFADWLGSDALYASVDIAGAVAAWGAQALTSTVVSPLALQADALAVATEQADFLGPPLAQDNHIVPGQQHELIGQAITIISDRLGYQSGVVCFVIGAAEDEATTTLTVLRKL